MPRSAEHPKTRSKIEICPRPHHYFGSVSRGPCPDVMKSPDQTLKRSIIQSPVARRSRAPRHCGVCSSAEEAAAMLMWISVVEVLAHIQLLRVISCWYVSCDDQQRALRDFEATTFCEQEPAVAVALHTHDHFHFSCCSRGLLLLCFLTRMRGRAAIPDSHLPAGLVALMRRVVNYHSSWVVSGPVLITHN
ncbi:diacylglycerol kinase 1 [Dorcoceras hygrometricum]|uniref:Diacylglycerol kinase 1 n=1 Tax=Dorcoceras hygrometricum TaxID=472368 RepID=A0A2Z7C7K9_9LAMI|nr:diacylglycerol kinase 1 [Dorcoceras hygrometricum]